MASLAEKYVFERLAMLEKEHDEHLKGSSATVEKEPENTDGVEFKKEPITAVRYSTCGSWVFENKDYGLNDVDRLREVLEMDDKHLYEWATDKHGEDFNSVTPISRQEEEFTWQLIDARKQPVQVYASMNNVPSYFNFIYDCPITSFFCLLEYDSAAKDKAIEEIRRSIRGAIRYIENATDEEEEETEDE